MNFNNYLETCRGDDVLCHKKDLFKVEKFKNAVIAAFEIAIPNKLQEELAKEELNIYPTKLVDEGRIKRTVNLANNVWFEEGVDFEILKAGSSGWQKGKMKVNVTLEFIPGEPEENKSPLDDVRQEIDGAAS